MVDQIKEVSKKIHADDSALKEIGLLYQELGKYGTNKEKIEYNCGKEVFDYLKKTIGSTFTDTVFGMKVNLDESLENNEILCKYTGEE